MRTHRDVSILRFSSPIRNSLKTYICIYNICASTAMLRSSRRKAVWRIQRAEKSSSITSRHVPLLTFDSGATTMMRECRTSSGFYKVPMCIRRDIRHVGFVCRHKTRHSTRQQRERTRGSRVPTKRILRWIHLPSFTTACYGTEVGLPVCSNMVYSQSGHYVAFNFSTLHLWHGDLLPNNGKIIRRLAALARIFNTFFWVSFCEKQTNWRTNNERNKNSTYPL